MTRHQIEQLLRKVKAGTLSIEAAVEALRALPFEDLGFAKVDTHRELRTGFPEVIFCAGKTPQQVLSIAQTLSKHHQIILATHATEEIFHTLREAGLVGEYNEIARTIVLRPPGVREEPTEKKGCVLVICAGTADLPVAEEAAVTAETMGSYVERLYDVGVAGIHRLLQYREQLWKARILVVVAGMEGALASVVGGLVDRPVIAVPTSVGYGASFGGLAPLLTMLNSCAAGVAVVNIDNGFGAGYFAHLVNFLAESVEAVECA
ncbi:MAG TPA: nickel pincer cofactor biosynthesis protein LarB [Armatimonadetes bacterium]|nr:nickel pincer cofactor biosynthesis protein LarB [Armatimonadota bacterium]